MKKTEAQSNRLNRFTLVLGEPKLNQMIGWINGVAKLPSGLEVPIGGGWIHSEESAYNDQAAGGDTKAGDFEPYGLAESDGLANLASLLGLDRHDDEVLASLLNEVQAESLRAWNAWGATHG